MNFLNIIVLFLNKHKLFQLIMHNLSNQLVKDNLKFMFMLIL